jgi:hypothetical protein
VNRAPLLFAAALAFLVSLGVPAPADAAAQHETIVFIRHGEKPAGSFGQLDCQGLNRALALPPVLIGKFGTPDYLFAPDPRQQVNDGGHLWYYVRPLATIEPTAIRLGKPVNTQYGFAEIDGLQQELTAPQYQDALVFVAWEHSELVKLVRNMLQAAGSDPNQAPHWPSADFDSIYVLKYDRDAGRVSVTFTRSAEGLNGRPTTCP